MNTPPHLPAKGTILIVDDNPENIRILDKTLTERGYEVRGVLSGAMALRVAQSAQPDVILLDIRMPELDGYQVCQALKARRRTCGIPVIFISALESGFDKDKVFAVGGVDYITKPFQTEEVLARIENQLAIQFAHEEIHHLNAELEARVLQRTAQLSESNRRLQEEVKQRQLVDRSLSQPEDHFRRAILFAPFPLIIHTEEGEILEMNQTWTDLTGYTLVDIPTIADWTEKAYGDQRETMRSQVPQLYPQNGKIDQGELPIITRSGEHRIWRFSSANLGRLPDGRRIAISMAVDVTEQKLAQIDSASLTLNSKHE